MSEIAAPISQAERLRAVGRFLDERGWRDARIICAAEGVVRGRPAGDGRGAVAGETVRRPDGEVRARLAEACAARRPG